MKVSSSLQLILSTIVLSPTLAFGLSAGDANSFWNAYNNVFLNQNGSDAFYQKNISSKMPDTGYTDSFDIFVAQDVYLRTGNASLKPLINNLCNSFLNYNPPYTPPGDPWHLDGFNDDIGWFTLGLIRGYQITGTNKFLTIAMAGFDYAFARGWNTTYNDGGIWEENPEYIHNGTAPNKQPLSNDSLGKVACMIYQSTHNSTYLDKCVQIYSWVRTHLFNNGQIYNDIYLNGSVNTMANEAYNQGTFVDYANLLYLITGNQSYYNDAKLAFEFGKNNCTQNGIFSNSADYLGSWADEFARGGGNFVRDNRLWGTYYSFFQANANAILQSRRTDLNITWNAWNQKTPNTDQKTNHFVSAVAWLQYTPATQPTGNVEGIRVVTNNKTGLAIDSAGTFGNGKPVVQSAKSGNQNQRWQLTQNSDDGTWNIVSLSTWQALQSPNGSTSSNSTVLQSQPVRALSERWTIEAQTDGTYRIWNKNSGLSLDGGSLTNNGAPLMQSNWNSSTQQRWNFQ